MEKIGALIEKFGFPIIAAVFAGWMIYYVWKWATTQVKPMLSEANTVLIALIDRVRMLDNDLIRLNQKLNIILQLRGKIIEAENDAYEDQTQKIAKHIK